MSSIAFFMGMLRVMAAAAAASATSQVAFFWTPASLSKSASGTPVHSLQLVSPWVPWTPLAVGLAHSVKLFPEHSMK